MAKPDERHANIAATLLKWYEHTQVKKRMILKGVLIKTNK